jgi:hypothetical protein
MQTVSHKRGELTRYHSFEGVLRLNYGDSVAPAGPGRHNVEL